MGLTFSIITVCRNDFAGLRYTYQSLVAQSFEDFEWIVVDGGSVDGTVEYLQGLGESSVDWSSQQDKGIYDAMNKGLRRCNGTYVLFLNAGDALLRGNALATVESAVSQGADVIGGGARMSFSHGAYCERPARTDMNYLRHGLLSNHQATFFRRAAIPAAGYDLSYRICGDYWLFATMIGRRKLSWLPLGQCLVDFSVGGTSFRSPYLLVSEAWKIQRDVLGLPRLARLSSAFRRLIATAGLAVLSHKVGFAIFGNLTQFGCSGGPSNKLPISAGEDL